MAPRKSKTDPQIIEIPAQKMAVVSGKGTPQQLFSTLMPALYGSAYSPRFARKKSGVPVFKVTGLRARYPDAHLVPKEQWTHIIGLPVPVDTSELPQKAPEIEVKLETWEYGTVAQILHLGTYEQENESIRRLTGFIEESGYEITGDHEEEYLTSPDANVVKTLIRYSVKKK